MTADDGPASPGDAEAGEAGPAGGGRSGPDALAVVGPTATGKTELSVRLARRIGGEIVNMDSRQAYRGTQVGTAAPTPGERRRAPHHGVGFLDPEERYGAGRFARLARGWMEEIRGRGRVPILAGGTGFFLRALTDPVFEEPEMDPGRRAALEDWAEDRDDEELRGWVRRLDPELARRLDTLDPQRCARALELALLTGRPLSWWQDHGEPEAPPLDAVVAVLELDRDRHRARIRRRARRLLEEGWKEEVEALMEAGYGADDPPFSAVGYRQVAAVVRGETEEEDALERIFLDTWKYARRQRTWFRTQVGDDALRLDAARPAPELVERLLQAWRERGGDTGGPAAGATTSTGRARGG